MKREGVETNAKGGNFASLPGGGKAKNTVLRVRFRLLFNPKILYTIQCEVKNIQSKEYSSMLKIGNGAARNG